MTIPDTDWRLVADAFDEVLAAGTESRTALLAACDPHIAVRVKALLEDYSAPETAVLPMWQLASLASESDTLKVGDRLGPYEIVREIGHGGMGSVVEAVRREANFEKRVAIKTIAIGKGSPFMEEHFLRERRIVAGLEHPHIVTMFDGGVTAHGTPWFAMELVDGERIDAYCETHALNLKSRARLLIHVIEAVQYAHQHLIIHRDLKPGNILVTTLGVVKLLDFGVARFLTDSAPEALAAPMTIPYASPEQLQGNSLTTASDIFSLGIVMSMVVTQRHPFGDGVIPRTDVRERILRGVAEPLGTGTDLDAIVARALAQDPAHRYVSAELLAADLRHFLADEPVVAKAGGVSYRAARFVRRHAIPVAAATLISVGTIGALVWSRQQAGRLAVERDRAAAAAGRATRITEFVQTMLRAADPRAGGPSLTVADALASATARADSALASDPVILAGVLTAIGESYRGLGLLDMAEATLRRAVQIAGEIDVSGEHLAGDTPVRAELSLGLTLLEGGNAAPAESLLQHAESQVLRSEFPDTALLSSVLSARGDAQQYQGDLERAEVTQRRALVAATAAYGDSSIEIAGVLNNLGVLMGQQGRWDEAERLHRRALAIAIRRRGEEHPDVASAYNTLASVAEEQGDFAAAEGFFRRALRIRLTTLGSDHQELSWTYTNLGYLLLRVGRSRDAMVMADSTAALRARHVLTDDHPMVASARVLHGRALVAMGRPREAIADFRTALRLRRESLPPDHWLISVSESLLGDALALSGDRVGGLALLASGHEGLRRTRGETHALTVEAGERLARSRER